MSHLCNLSRKEMRRNRNIWQSLSHHQMNCICFICYNLPYGLYIVNICHNFPLFYFSPQIYLRQNFTLTCYLSHFLAVHMFKVRRRGEERLKMSHFLAVHFIRCDTAHYKALICRILLQSTPTGQACKVIEANLLTLQFTQAQ